MFTTWQIVKAFASALFGKLGGYFRAALQWVLSDFRHILIVGLALAFAFAAWSSLSWQSKATELEEDRDAEQAAHEQTVRNYRTASDFAKKVAEANVARVEAEQGAINQEISNAYQARLASLRSEYDSLVRLQLEPGSRADTGGARAVDLPQLVSAATGPVAEAEHSELSADQPRLDRSGCPGGHVCLTFDEALIASEQAEQLDALISWVERQSAIQVSPLEASDAVQ